MNNNHLYLLLKSVSSNSSIRRLTREGISYKSIAEYTNLAVRENLLANDGSRIILTAKGEDKLKELEPFFKKTNKEEWILPDEKNKTRKLDKSNIFVPRQDDLDF